MNVSLRRPTTSVTGSLINLGTVAAATPRTHASLVIGEHTSVHCNPRATTCDDNNPVLDIEETFDLGKLTY